MKMKKFNVVELNNGNKATILQILGNEYFAEIVNDDGITVDKRIVKADEINKIIYYKEKIR